MHLNKTEASRIIRKLDKIEDYQKKIEKETEDIRNIIREAASAETGPTKRARRRTPRKSTHSGGAQEEDNVDHDDD